MDTKNHTGSLHFFLLGLSDEPSLQPLMFGIFLSIYLITVLGNLLIILAVSSDPHLHTPMYFFLSNLSLADICLSSTTIPKMLVNIHTQDQSITQGGCLLQVCFVWNFAFLENCLLAAMAYDRFVAICHPLSYTAIMHPRLCALLILFSTLISVVSTLLIGLMVLHLSFCTDMKIPHFFCELAQVIKLACSNTFVNNVLTYTATFLFGGIPLSGIIFSYSQIVSSVLKLSSVRGWHKAFSTCGSHLCVVCLFYGAGLGVYISSAVADSPRKMAVASVMYTVVPQMLNPFIYSLRNRDMKGALRKLVDRMASLW
ncbi:PREDICTED: olfactory receptor 7G2-like isoform X1 [Dipodomys ordii]|uniref:Olfactory receptor n=1 Tax=Dipodomys ordii TaxID=10020 RepID=A0A1S3GRD6_DIPOR|nr:PREDICTED: olfactory receptor 7G2-like isoform X1 [Dipodomys ordii]